MHPDVDLIYSDEDKLGENGFEAPLFKPDWSPDFFLSDNYVGHLTAVRRDLLQKAGGFRSQFDSAQDYDLFFRVTELTSRIHHIPRVLYHWRRSESSSAISVRQKPEQLDASRRAIEDHLKRRGEAAHVAVDWRTHAFRVRRELPEPKKISIIIPNSHGDEALGRCVESLTLKQTTQITKFSLSKATTPQARRLACRVSRIVCCNSLARRMIQQRKITEQKKVMRHGFFSSTTRSKLSIRSGSRSWPSMSSDRRSER